MKRKIEIKKREEHLYSQEEKNNILNKLNIERKKKKREKKIEETHSEYSQEEKNNILNKLNIERKKKKKEEIEETHSAYSQKEKSDIFEKLDDERREKQDKDKLYEYKYGNKKVYNLENREFYKIIGLGREFFIKIEDCHNHSSRPETIELYHHGFDGLRKTKALVDFKDNSDKIFISEDELRTYFKASSLEEI